MTDPTGFRDLNRNGRLDPYEDSGQPTEVRVADLLTQLTLEEKAGLLFQTVVWLGLGDPIESAKMATEHLESRHLRVFSVLGGGSPEQIAILNNELQTRAAASRLGIPVLLSTDPRHGFQVNTIAAGHGFSQWPDPIGFAAAGDLDLIAVHAEVARRDYLATGLRMALSPMADLATEPRWARVYGTFGEDAVFASQAVGHYVRGLQGDSLGQHSIACMVKHFPGGGPQKNGEDPHFPYGREQVYPGGQFDYHLRPFEAALDAGVAAVMPYYGMPIGTRHDEIGFAFNSSVISGLLRQRYNFDGVVCTDWGVIGGEGETVVAGLPLPTRAWGVEHLSPIERLHRALLAGVDQFGGEECPQLIVQLVREGLVPEARIDLSASRILSIFFRLGLFDNPFIDAAAANAIVTDNDAHAAGLSAQEQSIVLLKNDALHLPLPRSTRVKVRGINAQVARNYADIGDDDAAVSILRIKAPFEPRSTYFLEAQMPQGRLDFTADELSPILAFINERPAIVVIDLDRPAVIPEIAAKCSALLGTFGASDQAVLNIIFGHASPGATLPFELPSSMEAVAAQFPDVPSDSANPLFPAGFGLTY